MNNFEKCKEEIKLEDFINGFYSGMCKAIHKVRGEEHCSSRGCIECRNWLREEYKPQILDKAEKKYLSNIIRPFRDKVEGIIKCKYDTKEYIKIELKNEFGIALPFFDKGSMYKEMKVEKPYTLKELGI